MKKIAVVMGNLKNFGGAQKTAIVAIEAVNSCGVIPDLYAFTEASEDDVKEMYKKNVKFRYKKLYLKSVFFKNFQIMFFKNSYDFVLDFLTFLPFIDYKNYFHYIHFPEYVINEYNKKEKVNKISSRVYSIIREKIIEPFQKRNYKRYKNISQSCNSQFTQKVLKDTINKKIDVLYPPIDINEFQCKNEINNRVGVVSLSRISREKNQLEQIQIAQKLPNIEFNLCGSSEDGNSYVEELERYIRDQDIKNVKLHINKSFKDIQNILCNSKIFLHSMRNEHFGMSTVEAICSGCVPVVHDSGGQKFIVEKKELLYTTINEAVEKIASLYFDNQKIEEFRSFFDNKKSIYDESIFKDVLIKLIIKD